MEQLNRKNLKSALLKLFLCFYLSNFFATVQAQKTVPDSLSKSKAKAWFPDAKLGLFIHWLIDDAPDEKLRETNHPAYLKQIRANADKFTARNYQPREWAKMANNWGAKYVVLTTKHHVGFALYNNPGHPFNAANSSPAKRDLLKDYADAVRAEGLKVGFYYSLPDRSNPDYFSITMKADGKTIDWEKSDFKRWKKFSNYMLDDFRFLLSNYGKIDLIWFDGDWERNAELWKSKEIAHLVDSLQPGCVINNRIRSAEHGDYSTPESVAPIAAAKGWWEFCFSIGDNWDNEGANKNIKSVTELLRVNSEMYTLGGNVLLNVAPDLTGQIPELQTKRMDSLGNWYKQNAEAIYGSKAGLPAGLFEGGSTIKGNNLYLFVYNNGQNELVLKGLNSEIAQITDLVTGQSIKWRESLNFIGWDRKGWIFINPPKPSNRQYPLVLKVSFKGNKAEFSKPGGGLFIIE